jgi:hypothetical protein
MGNKRCRSVGVVLLGVAFATWSGVHAVAAQSNSVALAILHVTVIDGTGAPARRDQTVLVSGDRIAVVGDFAAVAIPQVARTIDGRGRFLIPGLWDAHVHTRYEGIDALRLLVAHGITSTRNMSAPWPHLAQIQQWRGEIRSGTRVGPRLLTTGPLLDGLAPVVAGCNWSSPLTTKHALPFNRSSVRVQTSSRCTTC